MVAERHVEAAIQALSGRWKVRIVYNLLGEALRFGELIGRIPGVTPRMLAAHLRELERDGIVARKVFPEGPPRVEYSLTAAGLALQQAMEALAVWGKRHGRANEQDVPV